MLSLLSLTLIVSSLILSTLPWSSLISLLMESPLLKLQSAKSVLLNSEQVSILKSLIFLIVVLIFSLKFSISSLNFK